MKPTLHAINKSLALACTAAWMALCLALPCALANSNTRELERKAADITLLMEQLEDRRQQADAVLGELSRLENEIANEVRILKKSYDAAVLDDAMSHPRLVYNIKLMQQLLAYDQALEDKIRFYQSGRDKLTYLHQLVQDDLKMTTTIDDFKIDALTTQISMLVNKYLSEAHIIQLDSQRVTQVSPQQVWNHINGRHQR